MFEYKGSQFTLDQIEQRAKEKGLTLQEYLSANPEITEVAKEKPIEEVKTTPVVPDAVAGEEIASDTVLPSDPGLSDLVGPSETPKVDTSFIPFESPEAAKTAEQEIEILKKIFHKFDSISKKNLSFEIINKMISMGASFQCYQPTKMSILEIDCIKDLKNENINFE